MVLWEDLGGILSTGRAAGHPSLFAKGLQGGFNGGWREGLATTRAKGSLRDAFPFAAAGLPANFSTRVAWLFEPLFCLYASFRASTSMLTNKKGFSKAEATQPLLPFAEREAPELTKS